MNVALPIFDRTSGFAAPPASPSRAAGALLDSHGRIIRDLRLSVTDRCNFRCVYCMDPDFRYMPKRELLRLEEYVALARVCATLGVEKIRLTGGEPTLYPELLPLLRALRSLPGVKDLALTTNGSLMDDEAAAAWRAAGLDRVTLSLDSLRPERIKAVTRSDSTLENTIRAIRAAHRAGLAPVKVNAVIMRGVNDDEVADFADFALEHGVSMRLIEFMPLDSSRAWRREDVVTAKEMLSRIRARHELAPVQDDRADSTSMNFQFAKQLPVESGQLSVTGQRRPTTDHWQPATAHSPRIGIIAPVSRPFCGACSRLRITADGKVRPCLFSTVEWDARVLLRAGAGDEAIAQFIADAVWTKQKGHGIGSATFTQPERTMSGIGG